MVKWLAACVRHLAGRSGDKPAPPVRQARNENPVLAWEYALSVTVATQGKLCLSPLTDAERLVLFPEVLLPEKPVTHNRLPYHTCGHRPEKRCMVARLYRQEEAARSDVACVPQRLRFYVSVTFIPSFIFVRISYHGRFREHGHYRGQKYTL